MQGNMLNPFERMEIVRLNVSIKFRVIKAK